MTERKGFTFRGVIPNTERRTVAIQLTLLLTLLASCLAFAPTASAQVWQSNLKVADLGGIGGTGCGSREVSCSTQLSSPSFRFDGKTYQIVVVWAPFARLGPFSHIIVGLDSYWPRKLLDWKMCVNSTAFSLADASPVDDEKTTLESRSLVVGYTDGLAWEIGNSIRLAITSGPCP